MKSIFNYRKVSHLKKCILTFFSKLLIFVLLVGLAYVVIYPFLYKILPSFMSAADQEDSMVKLIPTKFVLDNYKKVLDNKDFLNGFSNTLIHSLLSAIFATASASLVGYGLARFKSKFSSVLMVLIVITMLVPLQTLSLPMHSTFRFFDVFGIVKFITGKAINLTNTVFPTILLSATSLGFRAGIFVILMRQYYIGIPNELIEAAYVDGSSVFGAFFKVVFPMAKSMRIVVFSLSFAWEWTDVYYSNLLLSGKKTLASVVTVLNSTGFNDSNRYSNLIIANSAAILAILPLLILYLILQKQIIQGIERSGLVG